MFPGTSLPSLKIIRIRLGREFSWLVTFCARPGRLNRVKARTMNTPAQERPKSGVKKCRVKFNCAQLNVLIFRFKLKSGHRRVASGLAEFQQEILAFHG